MLPLNVIARYLKPWTIHTSKPPIVAFNLSELNWDWMSVHLRSKNLNCCTLPSNNNTPMSAISRQQNKLIKFRPENWTKEEVINSHYFGFLKAYNICSWRKTHISHRVPSGLHVEPVDIPNKNGTWIHWYTWKTTILRPQIRAHPGGEPNVPPAFPQLPIQKLLPAQPVVYQRWDCRTACYIDLADPHQYAH